MKSRIKRKWSRVPAAEKRPRQTPGCSTIANERCKQDNCGEIICEEHKGAHSALHTFVSKQREIANA